MTRDQLINAIRENDIAEQGFDTFGTDFAGRFDISTTEVDRLAEASQNYAEFIVILMNEDWWTDEATEIREEPSDDEVESDAPRSPFVRSTPLASS